MTPVLEFKNVLRAFRNREPVLNGVSFSMNGGEVVGLLGRNGAGKTTLINIAMGMLFPQGGSVRVFGLAPTEHPVEVKRRIGYVAEDQVLPAGSTVSDLIAFHRYLFPSWDTGTERELLDRFALPGGARIGKLSKGQARQVALLCAICHRPELLILDEPAGGLDPAARREFLEMSIQLLNRQGTAILFSSHHMTDVERLGGRVVLLDAGKVRFDRDLDDVHDSYCVAFLRLVTGHDASAMERLPGCLRARLVGDNWHLVFEGDPGSVKWLLRQELGIEDAQCVLVPLEELFIELVGGERGALTEAR